MENNRRSLLPALAWLAIMCSHVPDKRGQMARYYGYYGKVSRAKSIKREQDDLIPHILEPEGSPQPYGK
jgi:hypothetical protein